jgi:predicted 3-demethylubiquinone-9 3-methyltransferase (glyoxalase superfamily)
MQKITPFLWFANNAEEAVNFYVSIFKDGKIKQVTRMQDERGGGEAVLVIAFELFGQEFTALNGGPAFQFTEAVSFVVNCNDQSEIDYYWDKLVDGGTPQQCGWLKDKYGLSWQIVPTALNRLLAEKDPKKRNNVMQALMKMVKLDINVLENA